MRRRLVAVREFFAAMSWPEVMGLAVSSVLAGWLFTVSWVLWFPAVVIVALCLLVARVDQALVDARSQAAVALERAISAEDQLRELRGMALVVDLRSRGAR